MEWLEYAEWMGYRPRWRSRLSYHLRPAHFDSTTIAFTQHCLTTNHICAIRKHGHTNERIAVSVPINDGLFVFKFTVGNSFISIAIHDLKLPSLFFLALHGDIDVGNLPVHNRYQINTSNFGHNCQDLGVSPRIVYERSASREIISILEEYKRLRVNWRTLARSLAVDTETSYWKICTCPRLLH